METYEILKQERLKKSLSLGRLSELTGYSKSVLQRYESGTVKKIPIDRLKKLSAVLNIDLFSLLDFDTTPADLMGWDDSDTEIPQKEGDEIIVKCLGYDKRGRLNFSRKAAIK